MNKLKFWMSLGVAVCAISSFVGCSGNGSATKPNDDAAESSADVAAESSSGTAPSAGKEPTWKSQYPVTLNEAEGSFVLHFSIGNDACSITESSAKWIVNSEEYPMDMRYKIEGGKLIVWSSDDEANKSIFSGSSQSIVGIWKSDKDDSSIKFTKDAYYTTEVFQGGSASILAVESEINLTTSYIMYDLYGCGTEGYNCVFSHWHFTKPAPDFILDKIERKVIDIHEKSDRTASLTFAGKDLTINVEHVQLDSLNNGKYYIAATIQSGSNTCRFEHISTGVTKELCIAENVRNLSDFTYEGNDGKTYSSKYFNDNDVEFAQCVSALLK
ncbi:MAG: hypothetical protein MJY93_03395 [Fibrobacter sp.]|nr:hypothetical protein [Fibrobacter sp.]